MKMNDSRLQVALLLLFGLLARLVFLLWGAEMYYGTEQFMLGGDTSSWVKSIENLIHTGTYTVKAGTENGPFFRLPGYSFFLGFFYLVANKDWALAYNLAAAAQIILDIITLFLVYKTVLVSTKHNTMALVAGFLYASYPFAIVWTPHLYAESPSLFFMMLTIYKLVSRKTNLDLLLVGMFLGISILFRVQLLMMAPAILIYLAHAHSDDFKKLVLSGFIFGVGIALTYGLWPLRNYISFGKVVLAQRVDGETHWSPDYQAFKRYIFSIQTDHQPQYNQIMNGQPVTWPDYAKALPGDSLLLEEVSTLSKTCGVGFSYFMRSEGKRDSVVTNGGCNDEIVAKFDTLRKHFIEQHPMRYYVLIPLNNVKKALFKNGLYKPSSKSASIIAFVLFTYRTILLVLGIISLVIMFKKRESLQGLALLVGSYFVIWYFFNSAVYKNMEIRYLLQADVLMLIPLSWLIVFIFNSIKTNSNESRI